jgi:hypothetical protein
MTGMRQFQRVEVGKNYRSKPNELLEAAKGQQFTPPVILSEFANGSLDLI